MCALNIHNYYYYAKKSCFKLKRKIINNILCDQCKKLLLNLFNCLLKNALKSVKKKMKKSVSMNCFITQLKNEKVLRISMKKLRELNYNFLALLDGFICIFCWSKV